MQWLINSWSPAELSQLHPEFLTCAAMSSSLLMLSLTPSEVFRKSTRLPVMETAILSSWWPWGGHKRIVVPPQKKKKIWECGQVNTENPFFSPSSLPEWERTNRAGGIRISKINKFPHGKSSIFYVFWSLHWEEVLHSHPCRSFRNYQHSAPSWFRRRFFPSLNSTLKIFSTLKILESSVQDGAVPGVVSPFSMNSVMM